MYRTRSRSIQALYYEDAHPKPDAKFLHLRRRATKRLVWVSGWIWSAIRESMQVISKRVSAGQVELRKRAKGLFPYSQATSKPFDWAFYGDDFSGRESCGNAFWRWLRIDYRKGIQTFSHVFLRFNARWLDSLLYNDFILKKNVQKPCDVATLLIWQCRSLKIRGW